MVPERLYGIPFTRYVKEHILDPLGMSDTTYDPEVAARTGRRADGFVRTGRDLEAFAKDDEKDIASPECQGVATNIGFWTESKETIAGQSGLISSPRDIVSTQYLKQTPAERVLFRRLGSRCSSSKADLP
jgi:CubicO group peptidase (beta-lactamase class C family)